jgi:hypothetical protein
LIYAGWKIVIVYNFIKRRQVGCEVDSCAGITAPIIIGVRKSGERASKDRNAPVITRTCDATDLIHVRKCLLNIKPALLNRSASTIVIPVKVQVVPTENNRSGQARRAHHSA